VTEPVPEWIEVGSAAELGRTALAPVAVGHAHVALSCVAGRFGAISNICNHVGGPLGQGHLDGDYVVCPWHQWKFHRLTGAGEPGYEEDRVPSHAVKVADGKLFVSAKPVMRRGRLRHPPMALARQPQRAPGGVRVAGVSTTAMDAANPRYSTSDALLASALEAARTQHGAQVRLVKLNELRFAHCRGYYSKAARACTWPCSITQMDADDQLTEVYELVVHWADVLLVATPIRWGAASALYYKMVERMNCIQNQITLHNNVLIRDKVAAFIITGGQDNVQAVAGQMCGFFGELGFVLPPFPFIGHSLGWTAEDMERNVEFVRTHEGLHAGARELAARSIAVARRLVDRSLCTEHIERGGRKANNPARMAPGERPRT
jgi:nitrite reductase/ring-hydroxylating ferredoxin subunit/multimeric flavodoxin WrbA